MPDQTVADSYAQAIVETITQPLLVLDATLRVALANPAFLKHFRVRADDTIGRPIYELGNGQWDLPQLRKLLEDILPSARSFDDFQVTQSFAQLGRRVMLLNARRLDHQNLILLAIRDITDEHATEGRRSAREERQQLLVELGDQLRRLTDPQAAMAVACELLGRHLGAGQVAYAEIDESQQFALVERAWTDGSIVSIDGRHRMTDFGAALAEALKQGQTVAINDMRTDSRTAASYEAFERLGLNATIGVPMLKDGRLVAALVVHANAPRVWSKGAIDVAQEVAERTWDTVERARAHRALMASEARFRLMTDAIPGIVWLCDADGQIEFFNRQGSSYAGPLALPATAASVALQFLHPDDRRRTLAAFKRAGARRTTFEVEHRLRSRAGEYRWFLARGEPLIEGGRVSRWFGASVDIEDRKRAEQAQRDSEARYRGIFENAGTGIAIAHLDGRLESGNPAYAAMLGYRPETGLPALMVTEPIHPEDRPSNEAALQRLVKEEIPSFEIFNRYLHQDGTVQWVHKHVSLLRDAAGQPVRIIKLVTDMTEHKQHEERVQLLMREVNHRAKNLLAMVQAIARQTARHGAADFLDRFQARIQALARSQDLLVKTEWQGAELAELVRAQLAPFGDLLEGRITLEGPSLILSTAAAQTLGMTLHELATNAGKFGALSGPAGQIAISWAVTPEAGGNRFAMRWQESGGPSPEPPGQSGVGSALIRDMIALSLGAEVELGYPPEGLIWQMRCPAGNVIEAAVRQPLPASAPSAAPEPAPAAARRPRILVVEDEVILSLELTLVLQEAGFEVIGPARSVAQAFELLRGTVCDAAILDINLGSETAEPIANDLVARRTPFVAVTGYSREQQPAIFSRAPLLAKPVRHQLLVAEVRRCLAGGNAA